MTHTFDEELYRYAKEHPEKIDWFAFAKNRKDFPDYSCLANPHLIRGSAEHMYWKRFFDNYFQTRCTFPFVVRIVNSLLIAGQGAC